MRHRKPPYSWQGLAAAAIFRSPDKRLTVAGIVDTVVGWFPWLGSGYTNWRDSIRHNLSQHACFTVLRGGSDSRRCPWTVDLALVAEDAIKLQATSESGHAHYQLTLWDWLEANHPSDDKSETVPHLVYTRGDSPSESSDFSDPSVDSSTESFTLALVDIDDSSTPEEGGASSETLCNLCYHRNMLECLAHIALTHNIDRLD